MTCYMFIPAFQKGEGGAEIDIAAVQFVLTRYLAVPHALAVVEVAVGAVLRALAKPVRIVAVALA